MKITQSSSALNPGWAKFQMGKSKQQFQHQQDVLFSKRDITSNFFVVIRRFIFPPKHNISGYLISDRKLFKAYTKNNPTVRTKCFKNSQSKIFQKKKKKKRERQEEERQFSKNTMRLKLGEVQVYKNPN